MKTGLIEVICGPMFSGKTSELVRQIQLSLISKIEVMAFKPKIDNRYESDKICTNDGYCIKSIVVNKSTEIIDYINKAEKPIEKVFIDEVQFFDEKIVAVVNFLAKEKGTDVILAGLIQDFKGAPFGQMANLLGIAQKIKTLTAICVCDKKNGCICRKPAYFTQRLIDGKPASYNSPIILVDGINSYTARCEEHWEVPDRPKTKL
ncbi:MAG TPA: thymidine kinase [Candidatus Woesebacteria bacterium]|nr:thymidine kinase [Candidatus Woesebacteria bacterium]